MKLFPDAPQHTEHSSNALEPLHSTIKQPPNCQNVSSFLFFPKLSVLVKSSPASCNIHLGPLQFLPHSLDRWVWLQQSPTLGEPLPITRRFP
ncbi:hypothetical protein N658DRAFT_56420 [Parathielavia hyrcaniae]|uniref:Uncharacterized protein n=1 Tax=Parathielavia hyrcaniae TaxID=113614 RepID=A0AAN6PQH6_9PEZI|nr:hypothetical protein N658DRAFT_56420 [Parathielavia hyrcaniae]